MLQITDYSTLTITFQPQGIRTYQLERPRNHSPTHLRNPSANSQRHARRNSPQPTQTQLPNHTRLKAKSGLKPLAVVASKTPPDLQNLEKPLAYIYPRPTSALLVDLSPASPRCHQGFFWQFIAKKRYNFIFRR
jgi:hypothetical protein